MTPIAAPDAFGVRIACAGEQEQRWDAVPNNGKGRQYSVRRRTGRFATPSKSSADRACSVGGPRAR